MFHKITITVIQIAMLLLFWTGSPAIGQNPLRGQVQPQSQQELDVASGQDSQILDYRMPDYQVPQSRDPGEETIHEGNFIQPGYAQQQTIEPARDEFTYKIESNGTSRVELANHDAPAPSALPAARKLKKNSGAQVTKPAATNQQLPWETPNKLLDLIMKISLNLAFVLSIAFGVILLAKKWMGTGQQSSSADRLSADSLSIIQTLRVDSRISIRLVKWRSNRFLIASDQNGIQSVNVLNETFDQTLQELESDNQLVKKLLAGLEL